MPYARRLDFLNYLELGLGSQSYESLDVLILFDKAASPNSFLQSISLVRFESTGL